MRVALDPAHNNESAFSQIQALRAALISSEFISQFPDIGRVYPFNNSLLLNIKNNQINIQLCCRKLMGNFNSLFDRMQPKLSLLILVSILLNGYSKWVKSIGVHCVFTRVQ